MKIVHGLLWLGGIVVNIMTAAMIAAPLLLMSGCATNPDTGRTETVVPMNADQALYTAYLTVTEVRAQANDNFRAGLLSEDRLRETDQRLNTLRAQLDLAKGYLRDGNEVQAASIIESTMTVLFQIRMELLKKEQSDADERQGSETMVDAFHGTAYREYGRSGAREGPARRSSYL